MTRFHPTVVTLLLAHVAGSYAAYVPTVIEAFLIPRPIHTGWIYAALAPVFAPIYLAVMSIGDFPHYYYYLPQTWACYTLPFVIVCAMRFRKTPVMRLVIAPIAITLFVTMLWLPRAMAASIPWHSSLEGKPAPDFTLATLAGATCSICQERGHVVLIDFWGAACPPCQAELKKTIAKLAADASLRERGLRVWTINVWDDADTTRGFMNANRYNFDVMVDAQIGATRLYPKDGVPTTYLVAKDGSIRRAFAGFGPETDAELRTEIERALQ